MGAEARMQPHFGADAIGTADQHGSAHVTEVWGEGGAKAADPGEYFACTSGQGCDMGALYTLAKPFNRAVLCPYVDAGLFVGQTLCTHKLIVRRDASVR
jgi:hypothetical protein